MGIKGDYIHKARLAVSQELVTKAIISAPSRGQQDRVCQPHSNQASEQRPAAFPHQHAESLLPCHVHWPVP